jgi:hypothetical protein
MELSMPTAPSHMQRGVGRRQHQRQFNTGAFCMGKYVLGWVMGIPVIVLVIVYMLFN